MNAALEKANRVVKSALLHINSIGGEVVMDKNEVIYSFPAETEVYLAQEYIRLLNEANDCKWKMLGFKLPEDG